MGVRMARMRIQIPARRRLHDPPKIHNGHAVGDVPDDTQVMGNKNLGQTISFLKINE